MAWPTAPDSAPRDGSSAAGPKPAVPVLLGLAGLIPFVAAAAGTVLLPDILAPVAYYAALVYGLAILSFLGGIHWGVALRTGGRLRFVWSVVPSLIGFFAVFAPRPVALMALAAGFVIAGAVDIIVFRREGPRWFAQLRLGLTVVATAALIFTGLSADVLRVDQFGSIVRPG
ncbi:MAG: DUF3429 domain-containing protein [Pseudomonadota bacterium]